MPSAPFETPVARCTSGSTEAHAPQKSPSVTNARRGQGRRAVRERGRPRAESLSKRQQPGSRGATGLQRVGSKQVAAQRNRFVAVPHKTQRPARRRPPGRPAVVPPALARVEQRADAAAFLARGRSLLGREAPLGDTHVEQLVVLPLPRPVDRHDDVELQVLRVVAAAVPPKRFLEVHVPTAEGALVAEPEDPDRVRLAGALQHQDAVALPALLAVPRVPSALDRPLAGREVELRAGRDVRREQLVVVLHDAHRELAPAAAVVQHLAAEDDVALRPHASPAAGRAAPSAPAGASPPSRSATGSPRSRALPRRGSRPPRARSRCRARPPRRARPRPSSATRRPG